LSPLTTTEPTTEPTTSPNIALSRDPVKQVLCGDERGTAAIVYSPHAITVTLPLPEQPKTKEIPH